MWKDNAWLKDMALYARKAQELAGGHDRDSFLSDARTHLAVMHTLAIVGEAAAQVSDSVRANLPTVPWGAIVGMRNKLIHRYFKADLDVVWKTIQTALQPLIDAIDPYLAAHPPSDS